MSIPPSAVVAERAEKIVARIAAAGGDPTHVRVMAVTKAFGSDAIEAAVCAGLTLIGESYVQEFVGKVDELGASMAPEYHFIGRLQRNKVRQLPAAVDTIQSVDRSSLASEIARRRPGQKVLVQVNIGNEAQKGGCAVTDAAALVAECVELGLHVDGLMGVAELAGDDEVFGQYSTLDRLADELGLRVRSMGMTGDLELAVRAGSTMVRVGTALFGPRPTAGGGF